MSAYQLTALAAELDDLAWHVAALLDGGEDVAAWAITATVERRAGFMEPHERPSGPVIGRRFARAHHTLLRAERALGRARVAPSDDNCYAA